jgi:succinoglycan biosynthesis transport protein ExoP
MTANGGPARLLRVHAWWILLVAAVATAAAYGVSRLAPIEYRSAAIVVVEARVRANTTPLQPEMGTEKELARSGLVVRPAAVDLGVDPDALAAGLTVSVAPDANVLTFAYDAPDPATAQRRAQAIAEAYVGYRNAAEQQKTAQAQATANAHATLVTPAYVPAGPVARPLWLDLAVGALLGLLLGLGTALVRDRLSDRIRDRADFERLTGAPVLATVPRTRHTRGPGGTMPVLLRAPGSPAAESYRYLRSRLQPLLLRRGPRDGAVSVLVTSARDGEGRSTTAANLAIALAQAGRSVVLVDADLRQPRLHTMLGVPGDGGLTGVLTGQCTLAEALRDTPVPRLTLLPAGPAADGATDRLEGPAPAQLLRALRRECDVLVVDAAALLSVSDAIGLAALADHVLLVGDYRCSTRSGVRRALTELGEAVDGNLSGVLLNAPKSAGGLVPRPRTAPGPATGSGPHDPAQAAPAADRFGHRDAAGGPAPAAGAAAATTVYTSKAAGAAVSPGGDSRVPDQRSPAPRP